MELKLHGRVVKVFTVMPRTQSAPQYLKKLRSLAACSEAIGCTGMLLFLGNDTPVDPWLAAHTILSETRSLRPLVAVNPVYMHPFAAARMISSLTLLFRRRIYLNLITGTSTADHAALDDGLPHDARYRRLGEYAAAVNMLLSRGRPASFEGEYYRLRNAQLIPGVADEMRPGMLLAGHSASARVLAESIGAESLQMLGPTLNDVPARVTAFNFGVVARDSRDAAVEAAKRLFPVDDIGQEVAAKAMAATDATWKRALWKDFTSEEIGADGYWLGPFRNGHADCPYLVGDHGSIAKHIVQLVERGCRTLIIDTPGDEQEIREIARAFAQAAQLLRDPVSQELGTIRVFENADVQATR
jgi:alkanesulfonate monooxygenase